MTRSSPDAPHADRLAALRGWMQEVGLDSYMVPVNDWTLGEYPAPHARRLEWLSGFTGSAGWVAVTQDRAALFTDGRYTLQGAEQSPDFEQHNSADMPLARWLTEALSNHAAPRVGYDAWLFSHAQMQRYAAAFPVAQWVADSEDAIDALWSDRPADPHAPAFAWPLSASGATRAEKERQVAARLAAAKLDGFLLTNPESPCWLLNLRGGDLPTTPQLHCAALIVRAGEGLAVTLFVAPEKISDAMRADALAGVQLMPEAALPKALAEWSGGALGLDPVATPRAATLALEQAGTAFQAAEDPCLLPRACKHTVEQEGMREAHRRDGAALVNFFYWLEHALQTRDAAHWPTEMEIVEAVRAQREAQSDFWGPSFDTIAGFGPNGAIVHYRPELASNRRLELGSLLLLDSGGQYLMGTTDTTRTLAIGEVSATLRAHYTQVLAGHIQLGMARFPAMVKGKGGTTGSQLDALARAPLWQAGLDYDHGTGHGVGTFLNVHEGPQRISKRGGDTVALQPGMVVSNEPGYYKTGAYGIRIENLVLVRECAELPGFLSFETLTCAPYDRHLIEPALLTPHALAWLNAYHRWVLETLQPRLEPPVVAWLAEACAPIGR